MPVIRIEALPPKALDTAGLLHSVAEAAAQAFGTPMKHCWVTFTPLAGGTYIEGGRVRDEDEADQVSPLVTVIAAHGRSPDVKQSVLRALADSVGRGLGVEPDNVFVEYREIPPGHVFTGGKIR